MQREFIGSVSSDQLATFERAGVSLATLAAARSAAQQRTVRSSSSLSGASLGVKVVEPGSEVQLCSCSGAGCLLSSLPTLRTLAACTRKVRRGGMGRRG